MAQRTPIMLAVVFLAAVTAAVANTASPMANGRAIFLTGRDLAGKPISAHPAPMRASCAACHRADGSGGVHLPGGAVSADLRHAAMVTHQKHPYTLAMLERTISTGVDNEGKQLHPVMPRWRLSKNDLHDVAAYVMTLK
jgi:mono/diheme cytochrome c family protein